MNPAKFRRIRRLFEAAVNIPVPDQRAFVERFCVEDDGVRDEVLGLLEADREMDTTSHLLDEGGVRRTSVIEIPEKIGPYRAVRVIAQGGMGMVYEGIQESPRRRVAIKTLLIGACDERALARFEAEIDVLARLEHPSIARIYSAGTFTQRIGDEEQELPYYVMEYLEDASSLTAFVQRERLSIRKRLQLFREVCEGVEFAHEQGVLHRDLKPDNILVGRDGRPKIIDFGTARLMGGDGSSLVGMTRTGEILGTLTYMSPEQLSPSDEPPDARCDVYALGCVLYELLVERPAHPAKGHTFQEMMASVVTKRVRAPSHWDPSLSRALDWVCMKAMSPKREDRYSSVAEFSLDLSRFLEAREVRAGVPSLGQKTALFIQRQPAVTAALVAFSLAAAMGFYIMRGVESRESELALLADQAWVGAREQDLRNQTVRMEVTSFLLDLVDGTSQRREVEEALDNEGVGANQHETAARVARELRFWSRSRDLYDDAQESRLALGGELDESSLRLRLAVLELEYAAGAPVEVAERLAELRGDAKEGSEESRQVMLGIDYLEACLAVDARQLQKAEALTCLLLRRQSELLGSYHSDTLKTTWLLGRILTWQGRKAAALQYLEPAYEGYLRVFGELHPDTLDCQIDFAVSLGSTPCPHARELLASAAEKLSIIMGEVHPSTLHARVHHERVVLEEGVERGQMERIASTLVLCRATLGEEHPLTLLCAELQSQVAEVP